MKKILFVVLAAVGLASCVQTEELGVANNNEAIAFDPFVENATKASMHTTGNLESFNVYGTISKNGAVVTNIFPGVPVTKDTNTGVWAYEPQYTQYWVAGFTYDFAAVVDATVAQVANGMPTILSTNLQEQKDVLYATESREYNGGQAEKVSFTFAHLLSKAKFTVKNTITAGTGFEYSIKSIKILNADESGEYDVEARAWTATGTYKADFGVDADLAKGGSASGADVLLLPRKNKDLSIAVEYKLTYNGAELVNTTKNLTAVLTLEQGKAYNFIVEFGNPGEEIEFEAEVKDWDTDFQGSVSHYVSTAAELEAKANAATEDITIALGADITGDVMLVEKPGVHVTIDGNGHKYDGQIKIHNNSDYNNGAVTIKNVKFETASNDVNFIYAVEFETGKRYSQNITVENCTFEAVASRATNTTVVGVQAKASKNLVVKNCTAKNIHSLLQAQSCDTDVIVEGCKVEGCKNGVAFKQVKNAVVEGTTIAATAYGIRFDGNIDNYGIVVKNNNITANQPLIVRKMTGQNNTITLVGTNTLTTDANPAYQVIITKGSDDEAYAEPTGTYTLTGADDYMVYPAIENYDAFLAKISDDTWYDATKTELVIEDVADFAAFVETVNSGNDFDGKTLKLTGDIDLYFKDVTAMADGDPITFRPIGDTQYNGNKPFKGTFDGQNHTIKNLYQNGWDLGYEWGVYGSYGLFGSLEDATVKNVVIEGSESYIEGGDVSFIAGSATGNCVFENITINSGVAATYNNGCGGIIGWSGAGNYTFKNITIGEDAVLGGLWGSFDSSIGGIVGQAEPGATYNFENVTINCRIDAYNDCTASYDYYNYRMCGMVIGRCKETTTIDGKNYPDLSKYNLSFNNVVVNYGDWMNYHYCRVNGQRAVRVEPGYSYGGAEGRDHSQDNQFCMEWIPFNQLIGGDQYAVKGLPAVDGVTVNYPESFYLEQGYKVEGNTYSIYSGQGFKTIATTVLADGTKNVTIELAKDIDLDGIEWPAVKTAAAFVLDGKGYAIKNLTTSAVEDHGFYSTAMFTSTRKATTIKNLVVENATVTGKGGDNSHGAVLVACNYAALNIEGVTIKNSTVSNCDRSSVIATYLYFTNATVKNCVVEGCTVNSIGTAGALLGMNNCHNFEATGNTVKNTTISSSEGNNKAGILIGTWQTAGTLTESGNVVENSKAINAGTETNNNVGREV